MPLILFLVRLDTVMKGFRFARFVELQVRVLEIGIIAALALRWYDATAGFFYRMALPQAVYEAATSFLFLAVLLLLVATLWYLFTGHPRATVLAIRTSIYIAAIVLSPFRMPASAHSPQHSSEVPYLVSH